MDVLVNGEIKKLSCRIPQCAEDIANDLVLNSGEKLDYDKESERPVMTAEQYRWWCEYLDHMEADNRALQELKDAYSVAGVEEIVARESVNVPSDFNEHHSWFLALLDTIKEELGW